LSLQRAKIGDRIMSSSKQSMQAKKSPSSFSYVFL